MIERAIEIKYADPHAHNEAPLAASVEDVADDTAFATRGGVAAAGAITGRDYIKKIFQVPFGLPPVDRSELREFVAGLVGSKTLQPAQQEELKGRVLRHLSYFSDESSINPREVKRLINAYTLQSKLLSLKLGAVDQDSILALQVMAFAPTGSASGGASKPIPTGSSIGSSRGWEQRQAPTPCGSTGSPCLRGSWTMSTAVLPNLC